MKILVIDDDPALRRTIERVLRFDGHEVLTAENGRHGMSLFDAARPQIVITDIIMPEQEGIETIVAMRRDNPAARIIAISGGACVGDLDVLKMAQLLGADAVIAKPFRPNELLARVRELAPAAEGQPSG